MRISIATAGAVFAVAAGVWPGTAGAAPQAFGLVATTSPVPLHCTDGVCEAELSAFCLQRERDVPATGTPYRLTDGSEVAVVVNTTNGETVRLSGREFLAFESRRNFTAVTVSLGEDRLAALDAESIAVEVEPLATLLPVPTGADGAPQTESEIADVTGPWRDIARKLIDNAGSGIEAARHTSRVLNRMAAGVEGDPWTATFGVSPTMGRQNRGMAEASYAYILCSKASTTTGPVDLRRCLERRHDGFMSDLNLNYWKAVDDPTGF